MKEPSVAPHWVCARFITVKQPHHSGAPLPCPNILGHLGVDTYFARVITIKQTHHSGATLPCPDNLGHLGVV